MSNNPEKRNDLMTWVILILLLCFVPPLGILFLVLKLLDGKKKSSGRSRHPYYMQQEGHTPVGARTTGSVEQPKKRPGTQKSDPQEQLNKLANKSKRFLLVGGIASVLFAIVLGGNLNNAFYWLIEGEMRWFLEDLAELLPLMCCLCASLGCLWSGFRRKKQVSRYHGYLAMIGKRTTVSISMLASASGLPIEKVRDDLAEMLSQGIFPAGFLDYGNDRLVLSGDGLDDPPEPAAPPTRGADQDNAILSEIRQVNDAIANEKMSAQIDRIGVITAKILDFQKSHPEKAPQLHSFLSYYLPTTLKILRAYGQLEAQEVSGQNITAAMERIEGMMDKVVEGFEKQLDLLFQGDAMDITTDVEVLERMLAKDGLSDHSGMTLGL
jgi:hypothetical protein